MIPIKIDSAWQGTSDCRSCGIRDMVLFADLNEQDFSQIHTPIDDLVFPADVMLYAEGEQALRDLQPLDGESKYRMSTFYQKQRRQFVETPVIDEKGNVHMVKVKAK